MVVYILSIISTKNEEQPVQKEPIKKYPCPYCGGHRLKDDDDKGDTEFSYFCYDCAAHFTSPVKLPTLPKKDIEDSEGIWSED